MSTQDFDMLRLENQLCFPLYASSKEIIRRYKPFLDPLDLTYTQYIALMVLWQKKSISVKALGDCLFLDSGTMTPVLKKLESKGYITRTRSVEDERSVVIELTRAGEAIKKQAVEVPGRIDECICLSAEEKAQLQALLGKILKSMK